MRLLLPTLLLFAACGTKPPEAVPVERSAKAGLSDEARKNAGIQVVEAREETRDTKLEAPGQLGWNEERSWTVGVVATGKVRAVMAQVGDRVREGQVLARYHTHDVHDTQANLAQAVAERRRANANLEQLKRNHERLKRLYDAKAAPLMHVEQAESEVRMAEEEVRKAQANVERETHHLTEVLEIETEPSGVAGEQELVPVKAPHGGLVIERKVSLGAVVTPGQPAFVIADPESLWLMANFPEAALPLLRVGQPLTVEVRAYPGRRFAGRIRRLGESMDAATRTLKVVVEVAAQSALKPEMFATVRLAIPGRKVLVVPAAAIQEVDGRQVVFVEDGRGQFTARAVEAAVADGWAVIQAGLQAGERVAAEGSYMIKSQAAQRTGE
jgi:cobalt-zinc-cadmium efflux system membrane fusion protein